MTQQAKPIQEQQEEQDPQQAEANRVMKAYNVKCAHWLEAEDDDGSPIGAWFKQPGIAELDAVAKTMGDHPVTGTRDMLHECFLEGDKRLLQEDELFLQALPVAQQIFQQKMGSVKKYSKPQSSVKTSAQTFGSSTP